MPTRHFEASVVDASIARASGIRTKHARASLAAETLIRLKSDKKKAVFSDSLNREWLKHRSIFASGWLTSMYSRRQIIRIKDAVAEKSTISAILRSTLSTLAKDALSKDLHLVLSARDNNAFILSLDSEALQLFATAAQTTAAMIKDVVWIDPTIDDFVGFASNAYRRYARDTLESRNAR